MQAESNYFKVNRQLLHSSRWLAEKFTRAQAWVDLCGLAQYEEGFFYVRGIEVKLKRGQLGYSQLSLSKRWKWSRQKTRGFLAYLEHKGDIEQQNGQVTTIISIVNYDIWQGNDTTDDTTDHTTKRQQKDTKRDTYNKVNKVNKDNNKTHNNDEKKSLKKPEEVKEILRFFKETFQIKSMPDQLRNLGAAEWLFREKGLDRVKNAIIAAYQCRGQEFAPSIDSLMDLRDKYGKLENYYFRMKGKKDAKRKIVIG